MSNHQMLLILAAFVFATGLLILITKRNLVLMLIGLELMLNAANINLVVFNNQRPGTIDGQIFVLFVILIAVCEVSVGIALILRIFRFFKISTPDDISELKEKP